MVQRDIFSHIDLKVRSCLGQLAKLPGGVLYNGWDSLREGPVYLMGFNPGGNPEQISTSILDSLNGTSDGHCSYEDEAWEWGNVILPQGQHPHQKRVKNLAELLNLKIRSVFAVNAIFQRSEKANTLKGSLELWEKCWPVHQLFLQIVKPKIIICLGNGRRSSFSLLWSKFQSKNEPVPCVQSGNKLQFLNGKLFRGFVVISETGETLHCLVVGIPHPSRFEMSDELKVYLKQLRDREGWS